MTEHNEFLITCYVNNGDTGELIEKVRFILVDEDDEFTNAKDVDRHVKKHFDELCELAESRREYESEDSDVYRLDWVHLENEADDDDDDEDDEDDEDNNGNGNGGDCDGLRRCWECCRTA